MLKESLTELVQVAEYCVQFRKDPTIWGSKGCYGYPAAILLLSIADSIGSYVIGGSVPNHFNILNDPIYYNLNLDKKSIKIIYEDYRNLLTHNSAMAFEIRLDIGGENDPVFEVKNDIPYLRLFPFLKVTKKAVKFFLEKANDIVPSSGQHKVIIKKSKKFQGRISHCCLNEE